MKTLPILAQRGEAPGGEHLMHTGQFCQDGSQHLMAVGNDAQFRRAMRVLGLEAEAADPRFTTIALRVANRDALLPLMIERTRTRTVDEGVASLEEVDVPCGPINTIDRVFADPQVRDRGMRQTLAHKAAGQVPSVASPMRFSETPIRYENGPPLLGQHTRDVLRRVLGASDVQIGEWIAQGFVKESS